MASGEDEVALRAARAQAAVMRTLATELERQSLTGEQTEGLRAQAVEESARLATALDGLAKARSTPPPASGSELVRPLLAGDRPWPRVLVVEDDDETRLAIERGLAPEYEVVTARDGVEGLKAARGRAFDAIVTDLHMPVMDGVTMVQRIRHLMAPATIPVVFLSAENAPERIAAGFSAGATSYIVKPVDLELLDAELRWALGKPA